MNTTESYLPAESIAVIGMRGRFPGAKDLEEFWENLRMGVESISVFSPEELRSAGVDPALQQAPGFVNAGAVVGDVDMFDALFFGFSARDAEIMDPQQRLFLECAWESLEEAGYDSESYPGLISVFAGGDQSTYINHIFSNADQLGFVDGFQVGIGNDKDHLTTHVSYKLNLRGPSVVVQTACSTSLVAVCMACQSLLTYQSDIALAGGVAVSVPQRRGYYYQPGGIVSPDGHCRPFDAAAQGTVISGGVGIVVLKRLSEALADGDTIHAIIKGFALNNDGSGKVGYTAPGIEGQAQVVAMAQAMAGVNPETITYVEAHGTATALGDPIEIAALTQAFRARTQKKGFCAIGSVKSNFGHTSSAAGVAGLIKAILALKHRMLPPSLHYAKPNPQVDFPETPFYVNTQLSEWATNGFQRRAGVSSFGIGGTNAHLVLEEGPEVTASGAFRACQLVMLSAKTSTALESATDRLANHLRKHPEVNLADVAYTCQVGRKAFGHRRLIVCDSLDLQEAASVLERRDPQRVFTAHSESKERPIVFMFPGQGTQYPNMAIDLYQGEVAFREQLDLCCELLRPFLGLDLREWLFPASENREQAAQRLNQTGLTQPVLFAVEYALAKLWMSWGVYPRAMIGHSIGEYVAACLAGVFSLEDALMLVATRGRLMEQMRPGTMLAVPLSEVEVQRFLGGDVSLAAVNAPSLCVLSGPLEAISQLADQLGSQGCTRLHTSHAFHSNMMDSVVWPFVEAVQSVRLNPPEIPFVSNVTGTRIPNETATNPSYWGRQLRQTVRFADSLQELMKDPDWVFLEVGAGRTLNTLARQQPGKAMDRLILSSLPGPRDQQSSLATTLDALGRLWLNGTRIHWPGFYAHEVRHRIELPTYPFERQCYWVGPTERPVVADSVATTAPERDVADWFYVPSWKPAVSSDPARQSAHLASKSNWLIFCDKSELSAQVARRLTEAEQDVTTVMAGETFEHHEVQLYSLCPGRREHYDSLIRELRAQSRIPNTVVHLWTAAEGETRGQDPDWFDRWQDAGFYSLVFFCQGLAKQNITSPVQIGMVSTQVQTVIGGEVLCPAKATAIGACKVISQEYPNIRCRSIDVELPEEGRPADARLADRVVGELTAEPFEATVAYRKNRRWVQVFDPLKIGEAVQTPTRLKPGGVYLITGGLGNIGLTLAEHLAKKVQAKLVLTGRSAFPERSQWDQWLTSNGQEAIGRKIARLRTIEELGGEVLVCAADSANREQMQNVVEQALRRFGGIDGVIHGAGNTSAGGFQPVDQVTHESGRQHFLPKAQGLTVLEELFRGQELDFFLLLSSLSAVLGGLGLVAYAAGNVFMDAFASQKNQEEKVPWISVNWDAWHFPEEGGLAAAGAIDAILPHEGMEAFHRIVDRLPRQVVVSTSDLRARLEKWVNLESVHSVQEGRPVQKEAATSLHARPNLSNQYVPPKTAVEQSVAEVWEQFLGVGPIGLYDRFFELGGHSLLAIQVISRLRETFQIELPVQRLFEAPTVAELAECVERELQTLQEREPKEESLAEMLDLVEQLSEEDVRAMLAKGQASST